MTGAQRFARYATKMIETNQKQWRSKMKEKRENYLARMSEQKKDDLRKKDKERKKAKRAADKMAKNNEPVEVYKSKTALSKAEAKAFRALPSDPERAHEVVQGLAKRVEKALGPREVVDAKQTKETPVERSELKAKVVNFYFQPDVEEGEVHLHWQGGSGVQDEGLGRDGLQWNQAAEGDQENSPYGGLNPNEIEFLLNQTNNFVRFLVKVQ